MSTHLEIFKIIITPGEFSFHSIGNREAKELIGMTHEHELSGWRVAGGKGYTRQRRAKGKLRTTVIT